MSSLEGVFNELMWFLRRIVPLWLLEDVLHLIIAPVVAGHLDRERRIASAPYHPSRTRVTL